MTLRTKTSLLLAAITFLALGVTSLFYLQFLQQSLKNSILSGVKAVADSNAEAIAHFLEDSLQDVQVAALALPTPALEKNDGPALEKRLQQLAKSYPKFENGMFILDRNGRIWVDYPPAPQARGLDVSYRDYFQRTMTEQRGVVSQPYVSRRTGQPVLTFTALLRGSDNRVLGVLGCSVQVMSPSALGGIRNTRIGKSGYIYVYDKSRLMILHPEKDRVLKRDVPAGVNWLFDAALHGYAGIGETVNSRGVAMLLAVKGIPGTDWIVGAQQLESEAYAPITKARRTLWAGLLLAVAASLAVGTIAVRRITRPLTRLRQGVMLLEAAEVEGSHQIKVELAGIRSSDEIGELARAFVDMSQKLQDTLVSLRRASSDWELTFNTVPDLIAIIDDNDRVVKINQAMAGKLGVNVQEAVGLKCHRLFQNTAALSPPPTPPGEPDGGRATVLGLLQGKLGPDFMVTASALRSPEGERLGSVYVARDISERRGAEEERARMEAHLREVQKLESLGVLAGGIAHDFNNLLMAIVGNADLAKLALESDSPALASLEEITRVSLRAADLCGQMLAYSGRGRFVIGRYDLSEMVREMTQMLEVSVSKKASLHYDLAPALPAVEVDATQLRQIIMNLITNASEALGEEAGTISFATGVTACGGDYLAGCYLGENLAAGPYVFLEVADSGSGMDEDTRRRIFEPFFTTKFTGRGLGLAVVIGIVRGHRGAIRVAGAPGQGTTFRVLLPAVDWRPEDRKASPAPGASLQRGGTVLLVDDDPAVRRVGERMLATLGFKVIAAAHGREGLEAFRERQGEIDCVILDLTMPEMAGDEVFRELQGLQQDVCVILSSGYTEEDVALRFGGKGPAGFVQKPYTLANLLSTLNHVLGPG